MQSYHVWVTALTDSYVEELIGRLVSHNWRIAPLGKILASDRDTRIGCLIAFSMVKPSNAEFEPDKGLVLEEIKDTMKLLGMRAFSIVVTHASESTWSNSNVFKPIELNAEPVKDDEVDDDETSTKVVH